MEAARKAISLSKEDNYLASLAQIYAHFGDADLALETIQKVIDIPTAGQFSPLPTCVGIPFAKTRVSEKRAPYLRRRR